MALADVTARYDAAAHARVEHHVLAWPAMGDAVRVVRALRRRSIDGGMSLVLEDLAGDAATFIRSTAVCPTSANDLTAGASEIAERLRLHAASGLDSQLTGELEGLASKFDAIAGSPHPAGACLEGIVSRYGPARAEDPSAVYVAADQRDVPQVQQWLAREELDAEVLPVSQLRGAPIRDALVLIGSPSRHFVSPWCSPQRASRLSGWLLTAPPAADVYIVTWAGHAAVDLSAACLFSGSSTPQVERVVPGADQPGLDVEQPVWLPPAPVDARIHVRPEWSADRDPVTALGVRLAGDAIAFFPIAGEESAEVVTWEHNSVHVAEVPPAKLAVGNVVLFRPSREAGDPELYARAEAILVDRLGPSGPAAAYAAKAELKDALARARQRLTDERLHYELKSRLNNATYARHILASIPNPAYIAPERPGAYDAVRHVLHLPPDPGGQSYRLLSALRSACRRAGADITNQLIDELRDSTGWQDELESTGAAQISTTGLGGLELRVIAAIDPDRHRVARTRLGRLLRPGGTL